MAHTTHQTLLEKISSSLNFDTMSVQEQEKLLLHISSLVFRNSMLSFVEQMDEPTREEFMSLMESDPSHDALHSFITKHIPEADKVVEEVVRELTGDILAVTQA